jgi:hypothetical protein
MAKSRRTELTLDQEAAWYEHKADLMEDNPPGMRPWGWWAFEAGGNHPEDQAAELRRLRLLSAEEEGLLLAMTLLSEGRKPRKKQKGGI